MLERGTSEGRALSAGLLAERLVLALGRAWRSEPLDEADRSAMAEARDLFEAMTAKDAIVFGPVAAKMLDDGYFDTLQVVELQVDSADLEERLARYAAVLRKLTDGVALEVGEREMVERLRELFLTVGERNLARTYETSRMPEEVSWRPTKQATLSF